MRQEKFDALVARAVLERTHDPGTITALVERQVITADRPFVRADAWRLRQAGSSFPRDFRSGRSKLTPFASRKSNVATFSSAKRRMRSKSANLCRSGSVQRL